MQGVIRESFEAAFPGAEVFDYHISQSSASYPHQSWWTGPWDDDNFDMLPMQITKHSTIFKLKGDLHTAICKEKTEQNVYEKEKYTSRTEWNC
jgi:hypothetical protein